MENTVRLLLRNPKPRDLSLVTSVVNDLKLLRRLGLRLEPTSVDLIKAFVLQRHRVDDRLDVEVKEHVVKELLQDPNRSRKLGHGRLHCFCAVLRRDVKMEWRDQPLHLQVVHEEEFNGTFLRRVLEEIDLVVLMHGRGLIALHNAAPAASDHKAQTGPPLDEK